MSVSEDTLRYRINMGNQTCPGLVLQAVAWGTFFLLSGPSHY